MRGLRLFVLMVLTLFLLACTTAAPTPAPTATIGETASQATATAPVAATDAPATEASTEVPAEAIPAPATEVPADPTAAPTTEGGELIVFAAASLTEAFEELGTLFESQQPDTSVIFNFAGSNQLAQQIGQGAPVDVFASANGTQMGVAIESTRITTGTQASFVRNRLVIVTPADNPGGVESLADLATPGLKVVFADEAVPVGQYSLQVLDNASADSAYIPDFKDNVIANVVSYEENVRAVLSKVLLGEADAGIVYTSDISLDSADQVAQVEIPDALNVIASYPIAPLNDSEKPDLAQAFIDLVQSPEGQQILVKYGFISVIGSETGAAPTAQPLAISGLVDTPLTLTADDVKGMTQTDIQATDRDSTEQTYTGVLISDLLSQAGVQAEATEVVFTGGDGYSQAVPLADLTECADCIVALVENDAFRNILPATMPRYWVKGLVMMEVR